MAFRTPRFNLQLAIYPSFDPLTTPPPAARLVVPALIRASRYSPFYLLGAPTATATFLLVPRGTDVRPILGFLAGPPDILEFPAHSQRWYEPLAIEDVAKGYPNEYRSILALQLAYTGAPPIP